MKRRRYDKVGSTLILDKPVVAMSRGSAGVDGEGSLSCLSVMHIAGYLLIRRAQSRTAWINAMDYLQNLSILPSQTPWGGDRDAFLRHKEVEEMEHKVTDDVYTSLD